MELLVNEFAAIVAEESDVLELLLHNLQQEREAIVTFDLERITALQKAKHELLLQIEVLETSRRGIMQRLATMFGVTGYPTAAFIIERIPDRALAERVDQQLSCLRSMAQAVQELNDSQRHFVTHSLNEVQASLGLLEALRGQGQYACYGSNGQVNDRAGQTSSVVSRSV